MPNHDIKPKEGSVALWKVGRQRSWVRIQHCFRIFQIGKSKHDFLFQNKDKEINEYSK